MLKTTSLIGSLFLMSILIGISVKFQTPSHKLQFVITNPQDPDQ